MRFSQVGAFTKNAIESWARHHLSPNCIIVSDGLRCFNVLGKTGFKHTSIVTGGGPKSIEIPEFKWVNTIIGNVKKISMELSTPSARSIFHNTWLNVAIASTGDLISKQ